MLRYRPTLPSLPQRQKRDWIILFEASAQRDPLVAGTQVEILRQILKNAEYDDTFTLLTVKSKVQIHNDKPQPARPKNVEAALKALQDTHLVGALDLQQGLQTAVKFAKDAKNPHLLHIGSGIPAMGQRDAGKLAKMLPESVPYVGVGVGKKWNRAFMKAAAERTGGLFTQINPDEVIAWRSFELLATLNTPRLLDVQVVNDAGKAPFLMETSMIAQGEELCALTRVESSRGGLPTKIAVKGMLDGKPFVKEFPVMNALSGAGYLPRTWAKLEIDRLLADNAAKHQGEIIALSKSMYVMSPFTSLLVLETDADYERFKVDKGRKDHWAMYDCPPKIPLVYEPEGKAPLKPEVKKKSDKPSMGNVLGTIVNALYVPDGGIVFHGGIVDATNNTIGLGTGTMASLRFAGRFEPFPTSKETLESAFDVSDPLVLEKTRLKGLTADWGKLPPREQKRIFEDRIRELSPNQQAAIETYFRELGEPHPAGGKKEKGKDKDLGDVARKMMSIERRLELARGGTKLSIVDERLLRRHRLFYEADFDDAEKKPVSVGGDRIMDIRNRISNGKKSEKELGQIAKELDTLIAHQSIIRASTERHKSGPFEWYDSGLLGEEFGLQTPILFDRKKKARMAVQSATFRYQRQPLEYDRSAFTDLVQYAPGLTTTNADVLATLEAEADVEEPKLGTIDAAARKLIDKARAADWQALTIPGAGPIPGYTISYNSSGQFAYERMLISGLREQVMCDGETLWHLYPEIGLAGKRPFSRHHHHLASAINPAFVPKVEDLARDCDVKAVDAATVAIVPHSMFGIELAELHLIFAKDGRLVERRVVEMPAKKVVLKQLFKADGSVEWLDADGKSLAKQTRMVSSAKAAKVTPNLDDLVVMTFPIRTKEHILAKARKLGVDPDKDQPTDIELFISNCVAGDPFRDRDVSVSEFKVKKGEPKLGYYVLINAAGGAGDVVHRRAQGPEGHVFSMSLVRNRSDSALARFLAQEQLEINAGDHARLKDMPGPKDGFIQRLTTFRNLWLTWHFNYVGDMPTEMAKVIEFLEDTPSPVFAYAVLDAMQHRANKAPTDHMMDIAVKRFGPISNPLGLGYMFRYEQARSYWQAGKAAESAKLFKTLHAETLKVGMLPPIDSSFREVMQMPAAGEPRFTGFMRQTLDGMLEKKKFGMAFQLAKQMEQLSDTSLSDEFVATILAKAPAEERNRLTLVGVDFLAERRNFAQADRLLVKVLDDKKLALNAELWRWRSELAQTNRQTATALTCMEKALELEFSDLPELVNLESIRADYRDLLGSYQKIAEAKATLQEKAPKAFLAKVIRAADRWRLIDADSSEPCKLAGKIFYTLGERDLAWDYWTTPIDLHPAESRPWLELADIMMAEGDNDRADKAFVLAFEAEPTNPDILWNQAQNQVRLGQSDRARQLYRQIADGNWQERFAGTVARARELAK